MRGAWRAFPTRLPAWKKQDDFNSSSFLLSSNVCLLVGSHCEAYGKKVRSTKIRSHSAQLFETTGTRPTSVISKTLSGSRLPPPIFLRQVTVPLCVTEMMRLATEQACSCRVASTTCLWPTCPKTAYVSEIRGCFKVNVAGCVNPPCTASLHRERSLHWVSYSHMGHLTAQSPSLLLRQLICALWEFC